MKPRAILWDNDGVLVDTECLFFRATGEVLAGHGVDLTEELYVDYALRHGRSLFELAAAKGATADEIRRARKTRDDRYADLIREGVRVFDGVREALAELHGVLPMAIVTASGKEHFALIHEPLGLLSHFDFVLADGDYEHHKPHPAPYLAAAERLGLEPEECLVIEDSERGMQAALAAGMRCAVIPSTFTHGGDFGSADTVLASARDVPALLALG